MCAVRTETRLHFFGDGTITWAHSGGIATYRATTPSHTGAGIGTIVPLPDSPHDGRRHHHRQTRR